ncbi:xanthine/uracil/vitamin C permease (AzgA family) [Nonomuraea thailandensis]|uniref:Xanthine/uracil/vitamin C permease (AzgA family) n=1 Tax=Nonomuraea thailandensis TaxID=1188745 RepID=A0A9X2K317_9ACTN|nr:hypothetical protein [Nonomuraea thailandensis]MCP2358598.1 xanthine/uracil/vitamin C permease (AzgA family) [Nonomuraea thailandensis]
MAMRDTVTLPRPEGRVSSGLLYSLRVAVTAQAAALLVAASFAGQAVESEPMIEAHLLAGMAVHLVALVQIVLAVLVWRPGRGAGWPALASVALFVVGGLQHVTWLWLGAHLPAGVTLFGLIVAVLVWAWSPAAARRR